MPRKKTTEYPSDGTQLIKTDKPIAVKDLQPGHFVIIYGDRCKVTRITTPKEKDLKHLRVISFSNHPTRKDFSTVLRTDDTLPTRIQEVVNVETHEVSPFVPEPSSETPKPEPNSVSPEDALDSFIGTPRKSTRKTEKTPVAPSPTKPPTRPKPDRSKSSNVSELEQWSKLIIDGPTSPPSNKPRVKLRRKRV